MAIISFDYQFKFNDGTEREFRVNIDEDTLINIDSETQAPPDWTKLEFNQCEHCPYTLQQLTHCPVAKSISRVANEFKAELSHKEAMVFVRSENRIYGKKTDLQTGLQSLFGLMIATSDCAHTNAFKPMARFHLPFSTYDETLVRVLGMYLTRQYLRSQKGEEVDFNTDQLLEQYAQISKMNQGIMKRIRTATKGMGDADKNAIIILDGFASLLPMDMKTGFEALHSIFKIE
jgi:hypothetical protein